MVGSLRQLLIAVLASGFLLGPAYQVSAAVTQSPEERLALMDERLKEVSQSLARQREYEASSALTTEEDRSFRERQHGATYHNISSIESASTWIADKGPGPQWWQGMLRPGFMARSGSVTGYTDYLVPVVQNDHGMWFFNPKASLTDDHSNEQNLGVGYRYLNYAETLILGGNVFFDTCRSSYGHQLDQVGAGVEFLTKWVDGRMNYYHPLTKAQRITSEDTYGLGESGLLRFDGYEEPLQGVDYEVGFLVPWLSNLIETRVYGGGYYYDSKKFKNVEGGRLRVEVMPTPYLTLEMKTDFDRATGTSTSFGGFVTVPFEVGNIFQKKNPFVGWKEMLGVGRGPRELGERMTDRVVRDLDIVRHSGTVASAEKAADMIYVDNSNTSGIEDGTLTHPYTTLAAAVGDVRLIRNNGTAKYIYVRQGSGPYTENFVFDDGEVLWGSGYNGGYKGIPAPGYPVISGQAGPGDLVTLGNNDTVMGLTLEKATANAIGSSSSTQQVNIIHNNIINNTGDGIHIEPSGNLTAAISDNTVSGNGGRGIYLVPGNDLTATISNNTVSSNGSDGISLFQGDGNSTGNFTATLTNNKINNNSGGGIEIDFETDGNFFTATLTNNTANENGGRGIDVGSFGQLTSTTTLTDNTADQNGGFGINLYAGGNLNNVTLTNNTANYNGENGINIGSSGDLTATLTNNTASNNIGAGIFLSSDDDFTATLTNNTTNENGDSGIFIAQGAGNLTGDFTATLTNNTANNNGSNGSDGIAIDFETSGNFFTASLSNNTANNNGASGFTVDSGGQLTSTATLTNNTANYNADNGINIGLTGNVTATITDNTASNNTGDGIDIAPTGSLITTISDNTVSSNGGRGIYLVPGNDLTAILSNNTVGYNGSDGISLFQSNGNLTGNFTATLTNNTFNYNNGFGIDIDFETSGDLTATFTNNTLNNNGGGIWLGAVTGNFTATLTNNTANNNLGAGIYLVSGDNVTATLTGNTVNYNGFDGIDLSSGGDTGNLTAAFTGNTVNNNSGWGIDVDFETSGNLTANLTNNTSKNNGAGIELSLYSSSNNIAATLTNNTASNNTGNGIDLGSNNDLTATLTNNTASYNGNRGINIGSSGNVTATLSDNTVSNNGVFGIHLVSGNDLTATLSNNTASYNGDNGFELDQSEGNLNGNLTLTLTNNTFNNNGQSGIGVDFETSGNFFTVILINNTANNNVYGIGVASFGQLTSTTTLTNNTANENGGSGISLFSGGNLNTATLTNNTVSNNVKQGLTLISASGTTDSVAISGNKLLNNGAGGASDWGLEFQAADGSTFNASLSHNTITGNNPRGVLIGFPDTGYNGTYNIDLGGGSLNSVGQNSIYGNTTYDVQNLTSSSIIAQSNWWGTASPADSQFNGSVDHSSPLSTNPNP